MVLKVILQELMFRHFTAASQHDTPFHAEVATAKTNSRVVLVAGLHPFDGGVRPSVIIQQLLALAMEGLSFCRHM